MIILPLIFFKKEYDLAISYYQNWCFVLNGMWQSRILFEQGYVGKFSFPGIGGQRPIFSNISVYCLKWLFEFSGVVGMGVWSATRDISLDPLIKAMFKTSNFICTCTCNCAGHHVNILRRLLNNYFTKSRPRMTGVYEKKIYRFIYFTYMYILVYILL